MYGHADGNDLVGTTVTFILGTALGALLLVPTLPRELPTGVGTVTISPVAAVLLASALAFVLIPLSIVGLYQLFAALDR